MRLKLTGIAIIAALGVAAFVQDDPLARLGSEVSGVLGAGPETRLLLVQVDHGVSTTRTLGIGEEYADGWNLESATKDAVVMRRGEALRTVRVIAPVRTEVAAAPAVVMRAPVAAAKADNRPPPPPVNAFASTRVLARAPAATAEAIRKAEEQARAQGQPVAVGTSAMGQTQLENLRRYGGGVNNIPAGFVVEANGAIWMADGGFIPPGVSVNAPGAFTTYGNTSPGGPGVFGSATSYRVNGDMITIQKAMQIGAQVMVVESLQVRSGQTATVRLPDGSIFSVTPTLRPG